MFLCWSTEYDTSDFVYVLLEFLSAVDSLSDIVCFTLLSTEDSVSDTVRVLFVLLYTENDPSDITCVLFVFLATEDSTSDLVCDLF